MENINKKDIDLSALIKIGFFLVDDPKVPPLLYAEYLDRRNANRVTNSFISELVISKQGAY